MSSLRENLKPRPCRITARPRFEISRKNRTFEVNTLFIIWLFALFLEARDRPVAITGE